MIRARCDECGKRLDVAQKESTESVLKLQCVNQSCENFQKVVRIFRKEFETPPSINIGWKKEFSFV